MHTYWVLLSNHRGELKVGQEFKIGDSQVYATKDAADAAFRDDFCQAVENPRIAEIQLDKELKTSPEHSHLIVDRVTKNTMVQCKAVEEISFNKRSGLRK